MRKPKYERIVEDAFAKHTTQTICHQSILDMIEGDLVIPLNLPKNWKTFVGKALARMIEKGVIVRVGKVDCSYKWTKRRRAQKIRGAMNNIEHLAMTPPLTPNTLSSTLQKVYFQEESDLLPPLLSSIGDASEFEDLEAYLRRLVSKDLDPEVLELVEYILESLRDEDIEKDGEEGDLARLEKGGKERDLEIMLFKDELTLVERQEQESLEALKRLEREVEFLRDQLKDIKNVKKELEEDIEVAKLNVTKVRTLMFEQKVEFENILVARQRLERAILTVRNDQQQCLFAFQESFDEKLRAYQDTVIEELQSIEDQGFMERIPHEKRVHDLVGINTRTRKLLGNQYENVAKLGNLVDQCLEIINLQ